MWLGLLGLLTTPYLLHRLGPSTYAVFALITLVSAYLSNLELGFGHGTIRFLARARAQGDAEAEKHVIGTSLLVFSCAAVAGGLIVLLSAPAIVKSYANFPPSVEEDAVVAVRLGAVVVASTFLTNFFVAALQVHGRFSLLIGTKLALGTLSSVLTVAVAALVADVRLIVLVSGGGRPHLLCGRLRRTCPKHVGAPSAFIPPAHVQGYGRIQSAHTCHRSRISSDDPGATHGSRRTGERRGARRLCGPGARPAAARDAGGGRSIGFLPFASGESARADTAHLSAVFTSHMRLTLLAMGPLAAFLAVFADPLLSAWVGSRFWGPSRGTATASRGSCGGRRPFGASC